IPSLATQMNNYLAANGGSADPNALYTVWGGANDVFAVVADPTQAQAIIGGAVTAQIGIVGTLQAAGAQYVLVPNLPDIGITPSFRAGGAAAMGQGTALAAAYNDALFGGLAANGLRVIPVDTFHFLQEVVADPGLYGFANVTSGAAACSRRRQAIRRCSAIPAPSSIRARRPATCLPTACIRAPPRTRRSRSWRSACSRARARSRCCRVRPPPPGAAARTSSRCTSPVRRNPTACAGGPTCVATSSVTAAATTTTA